MRKGLLFKITAVILLIMMFPLGIAAQEDNASQIVFAGGALPEDGSLNADGVNLSKYIYPTGRENYFDIELAAETTGRLEELLSVDAVLVMDVSYTMNETTREASEKRLDIAKDAVWSIAQDLIVNIPAKLGCAGRIALVTFDTDARTVIPWKERADLEAPGQIDAVKNAIYGIATEPADSHKRFTNIEGGLKLAENLLRDSNAAHKYVILFTDGFPTTYTDPSSGTAESTSLIRGCDPYTAGGKVGEDGIFYNGRQGVYCTYSTSYSDKAALKAEKAALSLKNGGVDIFSVGICENDDMKRYLDEDAAGNIARGFSVIDCFAGNGKDDPNYHIGNADGNKMLSTNHGSRVEMTDYERWLGGVDDNLKADPAPAREGKGIGSGYDRYYFRGDDAGQLKLAAEKITADLEASLEETSRKLWTASDPMPENIEFIGFYGKDGTVSHSLSGAHTAGGEDTAAFEDGRISWQLMNSGFEETEKTFEEETVKAYKYSLRYAVRLKNEEEGFDEAAEHVTNGKAVLEYNVITSDGESKAGVAEFPVPAVRGYLCGFSFAKTNTRGELLKDAEFLLAHDGSCEVCGGAVYIEDAVAVSDESGNVSFSRIPSGHTYTLFETKAPADHKLSDTSYAIRASYGELTVNGGSVSDMTVVNTPFDPARVVLTAQKKLSGKTLSDGEFTFGLYGSDGELISQAANSADGSVVFDELEFTRQGEYRFTVREDIPAGQDNYSCDDSEYAFTVTVANNGQDALEAHISVSDKDGCSVDGAVFYNIYAPDPVTVSLEAEKLYRFSRLKGEDFTFLLYETDEDFDRMGDALQIKKNDADGNIFFDPLTFDMPGEHCYAVKEYIPTVQNGRVKFDETVYNIRVTVTQRDDGVLLPGVEILSRDTEGSVSEMRFINTYIPPVVPVTGDSADIALWTAVLMLSIMGIAAGAVLMIRKKQ